MLTITDRGRREDTALGPVTQLKIFEPGYRNLGWEEVWEAFVTAYPGKWAVQVFPPRAELTNGKAVYHLWMCDRPPYGLNLRRG